MKNETRQKSRVSFSQKAKKNVAEITARARELQRVGWLFGAAAVMPVIGSVFLIATIYQISPLIKEYETTALPVFVIGTVFLAGLAVLPTNVLALLGGWAFDFYLGFPALWIGVCGAAIVMYFVARRFAGERLQSFIETKPKVRALQKALLNENFGRALLIVSLVRLAPVMPFGATNLLMATTGVPFKTFAIGTIIGTLPRSAAMVFIGSGLAELNFEQPTEAWLAISGIVATVIAFIIIGVISKRILTQITTEENLLRAKGV